METPLALSDEVKKRIDEVVRKRLISSLTAIFLDGGDGKSSVKKLAGESLVQLSLVHENSATFLGAAGDGRVVDSLTRVVLDKNSEHRRSAADILKHLCSHYTTNDCRFRKLKKTMINHVIPKVCNRRCQLLGCSAKLQIKTSQSKLNPCRRC